MAPRVRRKKTTKGRRLNASFVAPADATMVVPIRWVKFIVGLFLLAPCYILTATFFNALIDAFTAQAVGRAPFWMSSEFLFFSLGLFAWLIVYFGFPKWVTVYVFGHELTHVIAVKLMGGKVDGAIGVGRSGGHIIASKINTWIALAPYFVPIYSVFCLTIYGLTALLVDLEPYREIVIGTLSFFLGFTWCFHASFTLSMIPKGQTDLHYGGTFYSLTIIYLMNLVVLSLLLIIATPYVSFASFGRELILQAGTFAEHTLQALTLTLHAFGW